MSERVEQLRQRAREEAAERARRFGTARRLSTANPLVPAGAASRWHPPVAGETTCSRCGARASIGCRHTRPA